MFCPERNSYLQLVCAIEPRVINKAVRRAMRKKPVELFSGAQQIPPVRRLESMQPSLFAYCVDVTHARLGFGREGLRTINRELNSEDRTTQLQAIHTVLDQVQVPENAVFLMNLNIEYRLIDLMLDKDIIVREKVLGILTRLANYHQGRKRIMSRPVAIDRLGNMIARDSDEIRYAASLCLKTLSRDRCSCDIITKNKTIIETLINAIKKDYMEIVIFNLNTLKNLSEWDPVQPLKANAFQVLLKLFIFHEYRLVRAAMDCMTQLCKHSVGKKLADKHDMTRVLLRFLVSPDMEVLISCLGLMAYTTVTTHAKWRAKEFAVDLIKRLVTLSSAHNTPVIQLRAMQVIINLCDCPDMRAEVKAYWRHEIVHSVKIRTHEEWNGTSEITTFRMITGLNHKTMGIEDVETVKIDYGEDASVVNKYGYTLKLKQMKQNVLKAIDAKSFKD